MHTWEFLLANRGYKIPSLRYEFKWGTRWVLTFSSDVVSNMYHAMCAL
jgi:hypothetical protein